MTLICYLLERRYGIWVTEIMIDHREIEPERIIVCARRYTCTYQIIFMYNAWYLYVKHMHFYFCVIWVFYQQIYDPVIDKIS